MRRRLLKLWTDDPWRRAVLIVGLSFGGLICQGLPYWDVDYNIHFRALQNQNLARLLLAWISPVSADTRNWGFLDRTVQLIVYKLAYLLAGYNSWPYLIVLTVCYAGLGVTIYGWVRRLAPATGDSRWAAAAAAVFFLTAPGPVAALVWIADFAPIAELCLLTLTFFLWALIEETPREWLGFPNPRRPAQRRWMLRWLILILAAFLACKTKPDLRLLPAIIVVFLFLTRRRQWKLFAAPCLLMFLLAVPWNGALFHKLPPFVPGSSGPSAGFMWQPASLGRLREFFWSSNPWSMSEPTLSLAAILGPFLLCGAAAFVVWKRFPSGVFRALIQTLRGRAHLFVLIWFVVVLAGASSLAPLNYFFRIRYGILILVPVAIVLGSLLAWFGESWPALPQWAIAAGLLLFGVQTLVNLDRSAHYRRELGHVEIAVDQAYGYISANYPHDPLALLPDFLSYDYHPDAVPAIQRRFSIAGVSDPALRGPGAVTVLSWQPQAPLQDVAVFSGCRESILFDRLTPCVPGSGIHVMRYAGTPLNLPFARLPGTALEYLNRSYQACIAHQPWQCIAAAKAALAILPTSAEAWNNIAAAYEDLHMWDEAINAAQQALRLKPDFQLARNNLAWSESQKALTGRARGK